VAPDVHAVDLAALLTFAIAGSASPGPNNALLLTSGVRFGFRRTLPHVLGTAVGIGALVVACAVGFGAVVRQVPGAELSLRIAGSAYLLILAYRLGATHALERTSLARPLSLWQGAAFQLVNPKGWIFAVAVVATFLPSETPALIGGPVIAAILAVVVAATASLWAAGGVALDRAFRGERSARRIHVALAVVMAGSIVLLWI
jgi:threonine/homoserine/homoserine lactone efflux protein